MAVPEEKFSGWLLLKKWIGNPWRKGVSSMHGEKFSLRHRRAKPGCTGVDGCQQARFLRQLGQAKWVELQIGPSEWFEAVNTSGAKQAIDGLAQCARAL